MTLQRPLPPFSTLTNMTVGAFSPPQAAELSPLPPEKAPAGTPSPITRVLQTVTAHAKLCKVMIHTNQAQGSAP